MEDDMMQAFNAVKPFNVSRYIKRYIVVESCMFSRELQSAFGIWVARLMQERYGQQANRRLARDLGVSHVTIGAWLEGNKSPSLDTLLKIERMTGKTTTELMEEWKVIAQEQSIQSIIQPTSAEEAIAYLEKMPPQEVAALIERLKDRLVQQVLDTHNAPVSDFNPTGINSTSYLN
jgi:transcriptional regulator with XRE-family HTH domain